MTTPIQVLGSSFFSTHHASIADALAGTERPVTPPAYALLVGRARRFTSLATQMHIEVCGALRVDATQPPLTVFATCHGEIQTADLLIADFHKSSIVSSARFALSVHNSPSGLYSVATGSHAPSTTITGDNAFAAGWLEAALTALDAGKNVILSIADEPVPPSFQGPTERVGVAAAFLLGPGNESRSLHLGLGPGNESRSLHLGLGPGTTGGRRGELAIVPSSSPPLDSFQLLTQMANAATRPDPSTLALGTIQPGMTLELRFS